MTAITLGTLLLQYPVGRLSDKFDRRVVILGAASTSAVCVFIASFFGADEFLPLLIFTPMFGGLTFSLYSLTAHANDFLPQPDGGHVIWPAYGEWCWRGCRITVCYTIIEITRSFMPAIAIVLIGLSVYCDPYAAS